MKNVKRVKCLKPSELAYLLLISSVVTGCSQDIKKLPDYEVAAKYCKENAEYCKEYEEKNQLSQTVVPMNGSGPVVTPTATHASSSNTLNYLLLYHLFFRNSGYGGNVNTARFSNYNPTEFGKRQQDYKGAGVYTPAYVARMHQSIGSGKTSFTSSDGRVFKSAQYQGSSKSSITGKSIYRGGMGSTGRSMGIGS